MSEISYARHVDEDVRLVILRELEEQPSGRLNETVLTRVVNDWGHRRSRDYVRAQMRKLEELGAVTIIEAGMILIAEITGAGGDHLSGMALIEGVARPSRRK